MTNQRLKIPKTCEQCGDAFLPFRASTGQFCSNSCKFIARRKPISLVCGNCGVTFTKIDHKSAKYCSSECYRLAKKNRTAQERLDAMTEKTDYCWLWKGGINGQGYGRLHFQDQAWLAHRLMYHTFVEPITDDDLVRHYECDNPPCVNPDHLRKGTHQNNADDMVRHKRHAHGETSYAKLTEEQVIAIWHDTRTHQQTADAYGIDRRTVGHIKLGTTWTHLNLGRCTFRRYRGQNI